VAAVAESADRSIVGTGTPEAEWAGWGAWHGPRWAWTDLVSDRLVVVAPHPDDEVLAAGGLMAAVAAAGRPVQVVAVTGGDASHPGSSRWPVPALLRQRRQERRNALRQLGIVGDDVLELLVADGQVGARVGSVADRIRLALRPGDTVVAPWRWDGHPDHEATTAAVLRAAAELPVRILQAPIWGWHWARPEVFPESARIFELDPAQRAAKDRAIAEYVSQLEADPTTGAAAILPGWALARWQRGREVFFEGGADG